MLWRYGYMSFLVNRKVVAAPAGDVVQLFAVLKNSPSRSAFRAAYFLLLTHEADANARAAATGCSVEAVADFLDAVVQNVGEAQKQWRGDVAHLEWKSSTNCG